MDSISWNRFTPPPQTYGGSGRTDCNSLILRWPVYTWILSPASSSFSGFLEPNNFFRIAGWMDGRITLLYFSDDRSIRHTWILSPVSPSFSGSSVSRHDAFPDGHTTYLNTFPGLVVILRKFSVMTWRVPRTARFFNTSLHSISVCVS